MDAQQRIAWDCEISAAVMGNGTEIFLVPLDEDISAASEIARIRDFRFFGVMGYDANGKVASRSESSLEALCGMACAAGAFAELVVDRLKRGERGDSCVDALERLFLLEDPRS